MTENPEVNINKSWDEEDEEINLPRRKRLLPTNVNPLRILLGVLLAIVLAVGIYYFLSRSSTGDDAQLIQSKMSAFEQKIAKLEKQLVDIQEKIGSTGPDAALFQRVEALAQKVDALEKRPEASTSPKPIPSKPTVSGEKQYHTVQKGETLYRISKKYRLTVEELRKLNHLSTDQPLRTGQKILVSPER